MKGKETSMKWLLFVAALVVGFFSLVMWGAAKTAIHEIEAAILLLIATVCFGFSCTIDAIDRFRRESHPRA